MSEASPSIFRPIREHMWFHATSVGISAATGAAFSMLGGGDTVSNVAEGAAIGAACGLLPAAAELLIGPAAVVEQRPLGASRTSDPPSGERSSAGGTTPVDGTPARRRTGLHGMHDLAALAASAGRPAVPAPVCRPRYLSEPKDAAQPKKPPSASAAEAAEVRFSQFRADAAAEDARAKRSPAL